MTRSAASRPNVWDAGSKPIPGHVIALQYRDHEPPHFHARYGEHEVLVQIETGRVMGSFPPRALKLVEEWRKLRRDALMEDWRLARERLPLKPIAPLE